MSWYKTDITSENILISYSCVRLLICCVVILIWMGTFLRKIHHCFCCQRIFAFLSGAYSGSCINSGMSFVVGWRIHFRSLESRCDQNAWPKISNLRRNAALGGRTIVLVYIRGTFRNVKGFAKNSSFHQWVSSAGKTTSAS